MEALTYDNIKETFEKYNDELYCFKDIYNGFDNFLNTNVIERSLEIYLDDIIYHENELKLCFLVKNDRVLSPNLVVNLQYVSNPKIETVEQLKTFLSMFPISTQEEIEQKRLESMTEDDYWDEYYS